MAKLSASERARLPDRAFAYIDANGSRRLPIYDASHVRNALARFNQVEFEDEAARAQARTRLLRAAQRFRIVPVGFISAELRGERERTDGGRSELPTGFVTMMMTDIEGSTGLLDQLGDGYGPVLAEVRELQHRAIGDAGGCVVETRADEVFAVFESPRAAVLAAIAANRALDDRTWEHGRPVLVRVGIHAGYPTRSADNYIGMAVHTTARISSAAHGGQIVVSGDTKTALTGMSPEGVRFRNLGTSHLRGIPEPVTLYQVDAPGRPVRFPALRR